MIAENLEIPPLAIGDLVVGKQMGAYTSASATDFNLFKRATIVVLNQKKNNASDLALVHSENIA